MFECVATGVSPGRPKPSAPSPGCRCHGPAVNRFLSRMAAGRAPPGLARPASAASFSSAGAADAVAPKTPVAFENLRLFDGQSKFLRDGLRVVVAGRTIAAKEAGCKNSLPA